MDRLGEGRGGFTFAKGANLEFLRYDLINAGGKLGLSDDHNILYSFVLKTVIL